MKQLKQLCYSGAVLGTLLGGSLVANAASLRVTNQPRIEANNHLKFNAAQQDRLVPVATSSAKSSSAAPAASSSAASSSSSAAPANSSSSSSSNDASSSSSAASSSSDAGKKIIITKVTTTRHGGGSTTSSNTGGSDNKGNVSFTIPDDGSVRSKVANIAKQLSTKGIPYVWGGTSLHGFDCSGFVQYVYREAGVNLPRTAAQQARAVHSESVHDAQPGDLLFWGVPGAEYHVGIYIGGNEFIAAPCPGQTVSVQHLWGGWMPSHAGRV